MTERKWTPGKWQVGFPDGSGHSTATEGATIISGAVVVWGGKRHGLRYGVLTEADANLIAEAGTVANETGLTPRELLKQRDELLEALEGMLELERHTHRLPATVNAEWVAGITGDARYVVARVKGEK